MALKVGQQAPDFTLVNSNGSTFTLSKDHAGKPCILYFYPKDFTPGCTREACDFRDQYNLFEDLGINIYGISTDNVSSHKEFKGKHNLPFELLSDENGKVSRKYDVYISLLKISNRVTYLLDNKHIIKSVYKSFFGSREHIKKMVEEVKKK